MTERNPTSFLQTGTFTAEDDRRLTSMLLSDSEGVMLPTDMAVSQRGAGANMSVDVAGGRGAIRGDLNTYEGSYFIENRGVTNKTVATSDPTNPRIDRVIAEVLNQEYSGSSNLWQLRVMTGTPAGSPTAPALPDNATSLCTIAVGAGVTSIVDANITDTRARLWLHSGVITCTSTTRPSSPFEGMQIYETDTNRTCIHNGSNWVLMSTNGSYTSYTPTLTGITLGTGGVNNGYWKIVDGSQLSLRVRITLGTGGVLTAAATISLPSGMTGVTETDQFQIIPAILRDTGTTVSKGHVQLNSAGTVLTVYAEGASATYVSQVAPSATVPHTWAATDVIAFHGAVEINTYTV